MSCLFQGLVFPAPVSIGFVIIPGSWNKSAAVVVMALQITNYQQYQEQ
jgi:hypothetical protein